MNSEPRGKQVRSSRLSICFAIVIFILMCLLKSSQACLLPSHTVYEVLKARILSGLPFPSSGGLHFVRILHRDPSVLGGPVQHGSWLH